MAREIPCNNSSRHRTLGNGLGASFAERLTRRTVVDYGTHIKYEAARAHFNREPEDEHLLGELEKPGLRSEGVWGFIFNLLNHYCKKFCANIYIRFHLWINMLT